LGLKEKKYAFVTLHRPSNVDDRNSLERIMQAFVVLSKKMPVIFPVHPRTRKNLESFGIMGSLANSGQLKLCEPLGYHDTIGLIDNARFVLTDSGGVQEETTFLKIPCLTLRPNTERPVTITMGTNKLTAIETITADIEQVLNSQNVNSQSPPLWDGKTAERIIQVLQNHSNRSL
jgi:UDP-N-acetylglucosamine 2-epimerase (non-hydrolysing)